MKRSQKIKSRKFKSPRNVRALPQAMCIATACATVYAIGSMFLLSALILFGASHVNGQPEKRWEKPLALCWEIPTGDKVVQLVASDNIPQDNSFNQKTFSVSAAKYTHDRKTSTPIGGENVDETDNKAKKQIFALITDRSTSESMIKELNAVSGAQIWTTALGGSVVGKALLDRKNIYMIVEGGAKTSGSQQTGRNAEPDAKTQSEAKTQKENPSVEKGYIVRALSRTTGITDWQLKTNRKPLLAVSPTGKYVYVIEETGEITYIETETGDQVERIRFDFNLQSDSPLVSINDEILLLIAGQKIFAATIEKDSIKSVREYVPDFTVNVITAGALDRDDVYLGDSLGRVYLFDTKRGETIWNVKTGGRISGLSVYRDKVLVGSFDNYLYSYTKNSGRLDWKKRNAGRLAGLPPVFLQYAAVSVYGANASDLVDLETGKTVNRLILEGNRFFSGQAHFFDDFLIYQTSDRLAAYSPTDCRR